jgi:hypothetical protein
MKINMIDGQAGKQLFFNLNQGSRISTGMEMRHNIMVVGALGV